MEKAVFNIGLFDLETSNLNADYGILLVGVFYDVFEDKLKVYRWDKMKEFKQNRASDRELVLKIKQEMERYDIIVGYNSSKFDLPFLNTRLLKWGVSPLFGVRHIDIYYTIRFRLKLNNSKLDTVSKFLGTLERKTEVEGEKWVEALVNAGTKRGEKAMDYITEHCIKDVLVLKEIFTHVKDFINIIKRK